MCLTEFVFCNFASDELPVSTSVRTPKIQTIFGVVGMLKLLAGMIILLILPDLFGDFPFLSLV